MSTLPKEHLPWHRRFPKDMLHEAMKMGFKDFGAYCIVIDLIYQSGGAVPDDAHVICRFMGCTPCSAQRRLGGCGGYRHPDKCDRPQ
jgi:hypothetical protein